MTRVLGTQGYENHVEEFIRVSQRLSFEQTNSDILPYLPAHHSRVLDAGCGAGQNAASMARLGHSVVAVDPMSVFLDAAKLTYAGLEIEWTNDSLPTLDSLKPDQQFDFVLVDAVWHHLSQAERLQALKRIRELLSPGGRCAISLRNGPPGAGTHLFPTSALETISAASEEKMDCIFMIENQPSHLPGKEAVKWSRVVLERASNMQLKPLTAFARRLHRLTGF